MQNPVAPLLTVAIQQEGDIFHCGHRARLVATRCGFSNPDQVRIATAALEMARHALDSGGGRMEFGVSLQPIPQTLVIRVAAVPTVQGIGPPNPAVQRLVDQYESTNGEGGEKLFVLSKKLPWGKLLRARDWDSMLASLAVTPIAAGDRDQSSKDLLETLEALRLREQELEKWQADLRHLEAELQETNLGVVALYAELDEKAAALRAANELKGRFLRHVSHEFRTPLNSILALTHLLLRRTDGDLTAEQERQVGYIRTAAQDLTEMVNDLLDLAKVEAGKTELRITRIDLAKLFGTLRGVMRPLVFNDAVALIFEEPPEVVFDSDESKLAQILRNLISNALKFTERGEVRVSSRLEAKCLLISVTDTGMGIALEDQERIFQEFAQVDSAIQSRVKGTGLGLPLSRKLAGLLGGELQVSSKLGEGAVFTLRLPLETRAAPSPDHTSLNPVLIIDDEEASRYIARQHFRGSKRDVIECNSGSEGAERARFEHPALILLDLSMPDLSGFEVLTELKSDPVTKNIPILIHSSRKLSEADMERLGGRHAGILPKGEVWPAEILKYIRDLLGEPQLFSSDLPS